MKDKYFIYFIVFAALSICLPEVVETAKELPTQEKTALYATTHPNFSEL